MIAPPAILLLCQTVIFLSLIPAYTRNYGRREKKVYSGFKKWRNLAFSDSVIRLKGLT